MEDARQRKEKEKRDKEAYDRKLDEEIRNYNPFGRGGGGAPMKDQFGNLVGKELMFGAWIWRHSILNIEF